MHNYASEKQQTVDVDCLAAAGVSFVLYYFVFESVFLYIVLQICTANTKSC